jgi:hypothetical protein
VSRRSTPRRGRSRKRRKELAGGAGEDGGLPGAATATARREPDTARDRRVARTARQGSRRRGFLADPDERPRAPWHPLPLSELLILVGMIGAVVGATSEALAPLAAGLGAVLIGTLDFTLREHLSGYRSHAALLASLPTALLHGGVAAGMLALHAPSPSWIVVPLALDVPVFMVIFRLLRARFKDASLRRELTR